MPKQSKETKPLPFSVYFWTVAFLAAAGLADSIYLSISHYRVYTDIFYRSFCAISRSINCDTVSQSTYSIFLGIPVPIWGIMGYTFFLLFLMLAQNKDADKNRIWSILFLISMAFSVYSIILALISTFLIHSYCIMCIVNYGINFLLVFYTWIIRKRFEGTGIVEGVRRDIRFLTKKRAFCISLFVPFFLGLILTTIFYPTYWHFEAPKLSSNISVGITDAEHPWIGARNPKLVITEYTDYQCFQCKKMHFFLRQLIAKHPDKIRLIHRHFPMDHRFNPIVKKPFHVGSGELALLAIYAATQDKFWQMNDILFEIARQKESINIKELAEKVAIDYKEFARSLNDPTTQHRLRDDIWSGLRLNITGTPAYVINGSVYLAQIPPEIIKKVLD